MRHTALVSALLVLTLTFGGNAQLIPQGCPDGALALLLSGAIGESRCSTDDGLCQANSCPGNQLGSQTVCNPGANDPCGDLACELVFPGTCAGASSGDNCWGIMVCPTGATSCPTDLLGRVCISKDANQPTGKVCAGVPVPCPSSDPIIPSSPPSPIGVSPPPPSPPSPIGVSPSPPSPPSPKPPSPPSPISVSPSPPPPLPHPPSPSPPSPTPPSPSPPSPPSPTPPSPPSPRPPSPRKKLDKFPKFDQDKEKFTWGPRDDDVEDVVEEEEVVEEDPEGAEGKGPINLRRLFGFWRR